MAAFDIHVENETELVDDSEEVKEEKTKKISLHHWQKKAIDYFFNEAKCNAIFNVATGSGKTRCAIEILDEIWKTDPEAKCLVIVPKNAIIKDWYKSLCGAGIPFNNIGFYYGDIKEPAKITITNMQSLSNINIDEYDIRIWDEAHNYAASKSYEFFKIPSKYRIGLTATLTRLDNKHWKLLEIFDYNLFKYGISDAISDGIINPFIYIDIGVIIDEDTREEYEDLCDRLKAMNRLFGGYHNIMKQTQEIQNKYLKLMTDRKMLVNNYNKKFEIVAEICKQHKNERILIFNQFNKTTNKSYWELLDRGIASKIIHSKIEKKKREEILDDYRKEKFNILVTTKILDEGVNIPSIDVGIITAADSTDRQTVQRMGRILRKKDTISKIYWIYCIDTIEETYSTARTKFFKSLSDDFKEYTFSHNEEVKL